MEDIEKDKKISEGGENTCSLYMVETKQTRRKYILVRKTTYVG